VPYTRWLTIITKHASTLTGEESRERGQYACVTGSWRFFVFREIPPRSETHPGRTTPERTRVRVSRINPNGLFARSGFKSYFVEWKPREKNVTWSNPAGLSLKINKAQDLGNRAKTRRRSRSAAVPRPERTIRTDIGEEYTDHFSYDTADNEYHSSSARYVEATRREFNVTKNNCFRNSSVTTLHYSLTPFSWQPSTCNPFPCVRSHWPVCPYAFSRNPAASDTGEV